MNKKIKVGITGGIGSGKSVVCDIIEGEGFNVLRADPIAKDLMLNDEKVKKRIVKTFGGQSYFSGKPNTKFLAEKIFNDKANVEKINSIIHLPVLKLIEEQANKLLESNTIVFIESALIYEAKFQKMFEYVILVCADEKLRIERSILRDKVNADEIKKRMEFQLNDEIKKEKASFVIENNSTIDELKVKIKFILTLLTTLAK